MTAPYGPDYLIETECLTKFYPSYFICCINKKKVSALKTRKVHGKKIVHLKRLKTAAGITKTNKNKHAERRDEKSLWMDEACLYVHLWFTEYAVLPLVRFDSASH